MKNKRLILITALIIITLALSGCGNSQNSTASGNSASIGFSAPLSGSSSAVGKDLKNGAELAVKLANESGKLNGKTVKLVVRDDKGDSKEAASIATDFGQNKDIIGVVGHYFSSSTLAAAPSYNKAALPAVAPGSSAPSISQAGDYIYRVVMSDSEQSKLIANWAWDSGLKNVAIIYENDDYGLGLKNNFTEKFEKLGGTIVANETLTSGQTKDFSATISKLKSLNVDAVVLACSDCDAPLILTQAKNSGFTPQFLGVDALYAQSVIENSNGNAEGLIIPGFFDVKSDDAAVKAFVTAYQAEYGSNPGSFAAYSFDATNLIINGIVNNGATRENVKKYLDNVKDFDGVTGKTTFDQNGDVIKQAIKFTVKNGQFINIGK